MPQSFANILLHVVYSTKHRQPFLRPEVRKELFPYLGKACQNHGCDLLQVGGVDDHVHLLVRITRTITAAQLVEQCKTGSSRWVKESWPDLHSFAWQSGYGAFSLGPSDVDRLVRYILGQEEHHRKVSFKDEYRALMREAGIDFDEKHGFD